MTQAKLNNDNIAVLAGDITVFSYDGRSREYLSSCIEYLAEGVGIPANSCIDAPGEKKAGFAICRTHDLNNWEYVADHRGETVYSTATGESVTITEPGDYPNATTTRAPATQHDVWDGKKWVTDISAQHIADVAVAEQQKASLLAEAQATINLWQTELQLGIISEPDKASLIIWLTYIRALQAIDCSSAPNINWPVKPEL